MAIDWTKTNYILDENGEPKHCPNIIEWGQWFETADRHVALTETELMTISTVFLGIDHRFTGEGPPVLWETMVFDKQPHLHEMFGELREVFDDHGMWRYASLEDAKKGHAEIVMDIIRNEQANAGLVAKVLEKAKQGVGDE